MKTEPRTEKVVGFFISNQVRPWSARLVRNKQFQTLSHEEAATNAEAATAMGFFVYPAERKPLAGNIFIDWRTSEIPNL